MGCRAPKLCAARLEQSEHLAPDLVGCPGSCRHPQDRAMLRSEDDFRAAAAAYLATYCSISQGRAFQRPSGTHQSLGPQVYSHGWVLKEQARAYARPVAYLHRECELLLQPQEQDGSVAQDADGDFADWDDQITAVEDSSAAPPLEEIRSCRMQQSICWSSTWQVPVFYFTVTQGGRILDLEQTLRSPFVLTASGHEGLEDKSSAPGLAAFPQLSQGEHPATGLPCFYLHPCETAERLRELGREPPSEAQDDLRRDLEAFITIVSAVVDMRAPAVHCT